MKIGVHDWEGGTRYVLVRKADFSILTDFDFLNVDICTVGAYFCYFLFLLFVSKCLRKFMTMKL